jgi:TonB family protein
VRSPQCSIKLPLLIVALSVLAVMAMPPACVASGQGAWSWVPVKPPGENFSVRMPKQPSQEPVEMPNVPNLSGTAYSATGGRIYYTVKSIRAERGGSPQSRLNDFIAKFREALSRTSPGARLMDDHPVSLGGFDGRQYRINSTNMRGLVRVYSTRLRIYVLEVAGGDEEDAPVGWFLDSFTINEPPPAPDTRVGDGRRTGGTGPTPGPDRNPIPRRPTYKQCACDPLGNLVEQEGAEALLTRDAILCTKGALEGTDQAVKHQFNGDVILEVELLADGTVGGIKVVQSQPYGLDQKAVEAAQQYKFCPALQDGQPVTQLLRYTAMFRVKTVYTKDPPRKPRGRRRP